VGIEDRLARLEGRTRSANAVPVRSEEERRQRWLRRQRDARRQRTPKEVYHVRERLGWLQLVGKLAEFGSADQLIEDIMAAPDASGYRRPPETRSHTVVAREVYAAIHRADEGLAHLSIPPEWEAAVDAGDELREQYLSLPPEHIASWWLEAAALQERGAPKVVLEGHAARYEEAYGISEELLTTALGPNGAVLTDEERAWMLRAPMEDGAVVGAAEAQRWRAVEVVRQREQRKQPTGGE
jgi:hypothetical protein